MRSLSSVIGMLVLLGAWVAASVNAGNVDYRVHRITDKLHVIYGPFDLPDNKNRGFRNNPVIVETSAGLVVFDPGGSAYSGERIAESLKSKFKRDIVAVFNSHAHGDHWLGNEGIKRHFPKAVIYGHPKMKTRVLGADGERWLTMINRVTKNTADGKEVIAPDKTVKHNEVIRVGETGFKIYHYDAAHTDNDIMIEIMGKNALYTGDIVRNGLLGIMEDDASFKGNIAAIDQIIKRNFKYYIPGHGKVGGVEVPRTYRKYLHAVRDEVKKLYARDMADYEMKSKVVRKVSDFSKWVGFDLRVGPHISRAYLEIEAEAF